MITLKPQHCGQFSSHNPSQQLTSTSLPSFRSAPSSSYTCRQPVFLAYEPNATKRALLGIHLKATVAMHGVSSEWTAMNSACTATDALHDIAPLHTHLVSYIVTVRLFCRCSRIWGRFCASRPDILSEQRSYARTIVATALVADVIKCVYAWQRESVMHMRFRSGRFSSS